ncbi:hypothetical protein DFH07DRAFT_806510 [Mycena maculata]|uniref:Uncharacterized protein n=1 Tax=Mycena maculata TaxID=230809 RepID=A0AAD7JQ31_9AGAR|nr:hypothetical protein DFH07DRAFT_806510 [Mycena maculata]
MTLMNRLVLPAMCLAGKIQCACHRTVSASRQFSVKSPLELPRPRQGSFELRRDKHTVPKELKGADARQRVVSTLTPSLLTESDHMDLSQKRTIKLSFPASGRDSSCFYYEVNDGPYTPFPKHARGFFYFGPQPGLPPLAASIRFRCTPTIHPSSFADGYDLLLPSGLPWQNLAAQAVVADPPVLRDQLLREGHLTLDTLGRWRQRLNWVKGRQRRISTPLFLFGLHQLFPVDFSQSLSLHVVGVDKLYPVQFQFLFAVRSEKSRRYPFQGSALAHFELSPTTPHLLHLRIAQLLEPVVATDSAPPVSLSPVTIRLTSTVSTRRREVLGPRTRLPPVPSSADAPPGSARRGPVLESVAISTPRVPPSLAPKRGRPPGPRCPLPPRAGALFSVYKPTRTPVVDVGGLTPGRTPAASPGVAEADRGVHEADGDVHGGKPWAFDLRTDSPNAKALRVLVANGVSNG